MGRNVKTAAALFVALAFLVWVRKAWLGNTKQPLPVQKKKYTKMSFAAQDPIVDQLKKSHALSMSI
jgi:hypothetical protein